MTASSTGCACGHASGREYLSGAWNRGGYSEIPFRVLICDRCGLARTDPAPDPTIYARSDSTWSGIDAVKDVWSVPLARDLARLTSGRRLLDVGCNVGNLVAAARSEGFDALGVEIDPKPVEIAQRAGRNVLGVDVQSLDDGEFDVIVLHHVLEHTSAPIDLLKGCCARLAHDGLLVVRVPCYTGLVPRLMRDHWFAWVPVEHVWHFVPRTLVDLANRAGLSAVSVKRRGAIEPPSSGVKGAVKETIATLSSQVGWGDEVRAVFSKATNPTGGP